MKGDLTMDFVYHSNQIALYGPNRELLADVTFPPIDTDTVNINHTFVDDSLRGQGIAGKLLEAVTEVLEKENKKAVPTCSYAIRWFENHPEYNHLIRR